MPVTKEQAMTEREFHYAPVCDAIAGNGPNPYAGTSAANRKVERWRANGACQTWKRDASRFRLPVKFGLYSHSAITDLNAHEFHTAADCPNGTA